MNFLLFKCILKCGAICALFLSSSVAASGPCTDAVFGVAAVKVDQTADTASKARDIGANRAAETAFTTMLRRILVDPAAVPAFVEAGKFDQYLDFVHIVEEKNLDKRYIATLDFCFDAARVRDALMTAGLRWAELQSPNILVMPVWRSPDGVRAWHKENKWITGWWDAVAAHDGLLTLRILPRNLINERRFKGEDLAAGLPQTLALAATVAAAEQILVVQAAMDFNLGVPEVGVSSRLYDKYGALITEVDKMEPIRLSSPEPPELAAVRDQIIGRIGHSWQTANLIDGQSLGEMMVRVPASSLQSWTDRLNALDKVAVIMSYDIVALDTTGGLLRIRLAGSRQALQNALAAQKLQLVEEEGQLLITSNFGQS